MTAEKCVEKSSFAGEGGSEYKWGEAKTEELLWCITWGGEKEEEAFSRRE